MLETKDAKLAAYVTPAVHDAAVELATRQGQTTSGWLTRLIERELARRNRAERRRS